MCIWVFSFFFFIWDWNFILGLFLWKLKKNCVFGYSPSSSSSEIEILFWVFGYLKVYFGYLVFKILFLRLFVDLGIWIFNGFWKLGRREGWIKRAWMYMWLYIWLFVNCIKQLVERYVIIYLIIYTLVSIRIQLVERWKHFSKFQPQCKLRQSRGMTRTSMEAGDDGCAFTNLPL